MSLSSLGVDHGLTTINKKNSSFNSSLPLPTSSPVSPPNGVSISIQSSSDGIPSTSSSVSASSSQPQSITISGLSTPTSSSLFAVSCPSDNGLGYLTSSGRVYKIECNTNLTQGDFANALEPDLGSCIDSCATVPGCVAVSWSHFDGTCAYEYGVGQIFYTTDYDSSVPA